jgi:hypothetical protein
VATTSTSVVFVDTLAVPAAATEMGPAWEEVLYLPYGDTEDTIGTSPGGEGGTLDLGPEYGAQAPDGTWWILDAAKMRLARFAADGSYLGAVPVPQDVLVDGVYFQFQLPRVLADGTLVAFRFRDATTAILSATDSGVDQVEVPGLLAPRVDDGTLAYGFDDAGGIVAVDPVGGTVAPAEWFVTQTGARFRLSISDEGLRIELPDTAVDRMVPLMPASDPGARFFGSIEVATTADGRIHLFLTGVSASDELTQLAGYAVILPDGRVTAVEAVRDPFTPASSGSPSTLGAAFGASRPWFMIVDVDGVHVHQPVGG